MPNNSSGDRDVEKVGMVNDGSTLVNWDGLLCFLFGKCSPFI
jgi:hypothetical protein